MVKVMRTEIRVLASYAEADRDVVLRKLNVIGGGD